ncbi:MAG: YwiC-like family protein [Chrysiogenetes bacterium]|nr:YwiC-like family protein [Chrysiogenetes bacterium]
MNASQHVSWVRKSVLPTIPRQHGAWSALIACFVLGTLVARAPAPESALVFGAMVSLLCIREGIVLSIRAKSDAERQTQLRAGTAFWCGALALMTAGLWNRDVIDALFLPAVAGGILFVVSLLWFARRRKDEMSLPGELLGMAGLSLAAPAAEAVASGGISERSLGLWVLSLVFFETSVFHVRHVVRHHRACMGPLATRIQAGMPSVAAHLVGLAVLAILAATSHLPRLAPLVFVPVLLKALWTIAARESRPVRIKRIGLMELAHTIVFVGLCSGLYMTYPPEGWSGF